MPDTVAFVSAFGGAGKERDARALEDFKAVVEIGKMVDNSGYEP